MEASQNLEHWAEELKYLENQADEARATESTESWLHNQIQTANQMKALIFEIVQRGSDLVTQLEGSEVAAESLSPVAEEGSPGHGDSNAASQHTLNWLKQQNGGSGSSSSGSLTSNGFCWTHKKYEILLRLVQGHFDRTIFGFWIWIKLYCFEILLLQLYCFNSYIRSKNPNVNG